MTMHITETVWLNDIDCCPIEHLAEASGLSLDEIEDLIAAGVIAPAQAGASGADRQAGGAGAAPRTFRLSYVVTLKTARRLRDDFQLERPGLALALTLLQRVEELQAQLKGLRGGR